MKYVRDNTLIKPKQTPMNKKLIEQIEKIKGVKTVEPWDNKVVVSFEAERQAVNCNNAEQIAFIVKNGYHRAKYHEYLYTDIDEKLELYQMGVFTVIQFDVYLLTYNLKSNWEAFLIGEAEKYIGKCVSKIKGLTYAEGFKTEGKKILSIEYNEYEHQIRGRYSYSESITLYSENLGKWAEIIPDEIELIEGGVYCTTDTTSTWIFRFKKLRTKETADYYTLIDFAKSIHLGDWFAHNHDGRTVNLATDKQKKKLIRQEVKNGYFHELSK